MLKTPNPIPILLTKDSFSPKYKTPTRAMITRFKIVKIEIALDKYPYFNEKT